MARRYEIGWRPSVCICNFTLKFYEKKYHKDIFHKNKELAKKAIEKHANVYKIEKYPLTLNDELEFPTEYTSERTFRALWKTFKFTGNPKDYNIHLSSLEVLESSKVNYQFDEFIH